MDNLNRSVVTLESSVLDEPASKKMKTGDSDSDTEVEDEDDHEEGGEDEEEYSENSDNVDDDLYS